MQRRGCRDETMRSLRFARMQSSCSEGSEGLPDDKENLLGESVLLLRFSSPRLLGRWKMLTVW